MKNGTLGLIAIVVYFIFRFVFDHLAQTMQIAELKLGGMLAGFVTMGVIGVIIFVRSAKKK